MAVFGIAQRRSAGAQRKVVAFGTEQVLPAVAEVHAGQQR